MGILDTLGIEENEFNEAKDSTVTEDFRPMPSDVYPGKVKSLIVYVSEFKGKDGKVVTNDNLKIICTVENPETKQMVDVEFRSDIGKTLKDGSTNGGFMSRLKSVCSATKTDISELKEGTDEVEVNSFGKKCKGYEIFGANDKPCMICLKHEVDTNKNEGEQFRDRNSIEAILPDGHEDIEKFKEKVEKRENGIFEYKGYVKAGSKSGGASNSDKTNEQKEAEIKAATTAF